MPVHFQRPENALKRAKEFIDVGKKQRALDALYDVIKSKKHRTWQKIHEPIMNEYLSLCVDLKKSHIAKEGLYQYKNICQQVNIKSLEDVVRGYLKLAEDKTQAAKEESKQAVVDVDDLEQMHTPEGLLLSAVSGEDTQDRTDRLLLTPWVKFLWESYRQSLELLRNNSRVERLYHDVAQQAFKFCLRYTRKTEFRKLCDNLRTHLNLISKHQHQQTSINLNNPESQQMHLETRLVQLDIAIQMELWQEAFKASEDIHGLIILSKKPPKPQLMANYYQKLALIFFKSSNYLFHAAAWNRLLQLSREQRKNLTADEQSKLATRVMLATLSIPISPPPSELHRLLELPDTSMDKKRRLSNLLGLPYPPTRSQLVQDLTRQNIVSYVQPDVRQLHTHLEVEYHPLQMCNRIDTCLQHLTTSAPEELRLYVPLIQENACIRLLKQLSQVYETISFDQLQKLLPFSSLFQLEKIAVIAARNTDLHVRIDHGGRMFSFGTDLSEAQREAHMEGPSLQSMPSEQIRTQLVAMHNSLCVALDMIYPGRVKEKNSELRKVIYNAYRQSETMAHERILERKDIIEQRKVRLEEMTREMERLEQEKIEEQQRRLHEEERMRLEREARERMEKRMELERKEIQLKTVKSRLEKLKETGLGDAILKDIDEQELENMNVDDILSIQLRQLNKEKKELEARLKSQEKKVDYFVRALHVEALPLVQERAAEEMEAARSFWQQQEELRIQTLEDERKDALANRDRLVRMHDDKEEFMKTLKEERASVYQEKMKEFKKKFEAEKKKRLLERKEQRKKARKEAAIKAKEEAEQRQREEQALREREEKRRGEEEKVRKEKEEYEKMKAKLDEQARKQREKEREAEEKEKKRISEVLKERDLGANEDERDRYKKDVGGDGAWKPGAKEGGWRQRAQEKEATWRGGGREIDRDRDREDGAWRKDGGGPPRSGERAPFDRRDGRPTDSWRSERKDEPGPPRDERGPPRDERGPPRDERGPPRDERGPPRDERGPLRDERGPPRDERGPPRDERGPPRDERGPPRDERGPPRDERGPPRDERGPPRDERGPPRDERGPRRFDDRGFGRDDRGYGREDRGYGRDDRGYGRDDRGYGRDDRGYGRDDRGYGRDDRGFGRDDRGPRRDDRGPGRDERPPARDERGFRRDERRGPGFDSGGWRDGGGPGRRSVGGGRYEGRREPDEVWRRGETPRGPPARSDAHDQGGEGPRVSDRPAVRPPSPDRAKVKSHDSKFDDEDDGWTKVVGR